jgi:hypothetical protein
MRRAAGLTALLWRRCSAHNSTCIVSRIERTSRAKGLSTGIHWIPPCSGESDLHQNSNAGQRSRVQLTGSRSRMEEAVSLVGAQRQLCSRRPMRAASWARKTDPSCAAAATSTALHTAGRRRGHQGCILKDSLEYWQRSIGSWLVMGCFLNTQKRRNADAVICGPPVRQAQAACANFLASRACDASFSDSVLSAAL